MSSHEQIGKNVILEPQVHEKVSAKFLIQKTLWYCSLFLKIRGPRVKGHYMTRCSQNSKIKGHGHNMATYGTKYCL